MINPPVTLYHFESCRFCARVRDFLSKENIVIPMKDIEQDPSAHAELQRIGGKTQVPCLVVDGKAMYESLDIIEWFRKHWVK